MCEHSLGNYNFNQNAGPDLGVLQTVYDKLGPSGVGFLRGGANDSADARDMRECTKRRHRSGGYRYVWNARCGGTAYLLCHRPRHARLCSGAIRSQTIAGQGSACIGRARLAAILQPPDNAGGEGKC
jgi:hypothetical protein